MQQDPHRPSLCHKQAVDAWHTHPSPPGAREALEAGPGLQAPAIQSQAEHPDGWSRPLQHCGTAVGLVNYQDHGLRSFQPGGRETRRLGAEGDLPDGSCALRPGCWWHGTRRMRVGMTPHFLSASWRGGTWLVESSWAGGWFRRCRRQVTPVGNVRKHARKGGGAGEEAGGDGEGTARSVECLVCDVCTRRAVRFDME